MKKITFVLVFFWGFFFIARASNTDTTKLKTTIDTAAIVTFFSEKGLQINACENQSLYFEVYKWLGTPYRYGGNTENGLDCSGFSKKIYNAFYGYTLLGGSHDIFATVTPIEIDFAQEGDLLFFKTRKGRISHVGIYLSNGKFAHASTSLGVIISDLSEAYYQRTFYSAARIK